jgi:hypothetical protein
MGGGAILAIAILTGYITSFEPIRIALLTVALGVVAVIMALLGAVRYGDERYRLDSFQKAWRYAEPKPSDAQMNDWLSNDLVLIVQQGERRLSLPQSERGDVFTLVGPGLNADPLARLGRDGALRFSRYRVLISFMGETRMSTYECDLNMEDGAISKDETKEYHLRDIDGVETQTETVTINFQDAANLISMLSNRTHIRRGLIDIQRLRVVVSGRRAIDMAVRADAPEQAAPGLARPSLDEIVAGLRMRLRNG